MTVDEINAQAERLFAALREERAIYEALRELSFRQEEILASGRTDEILELVQAKGLKLDAIERLERELGPLKEAWPRIKDAIASELRRNVDGELDGIQGVLRQLIELENSGQDGLVQARQEKAAELKRVDDARRMQSAYRAVQPRGGVTGGGSMDRKE